MGQTICISQEAFTAMMMQQAALQQQVIDLQQELIAAKNDTIKAKNEALTSKKEALTLHKKLEKKVPPTPKDKDVFWHIHSGMFSLDAANSEDMELVKRFEDWLIRFAKKYIQPYVNHKVYTECCSQMTRGLPQHIGELQTRKDFAYLFGDNIVVEPKKRPKLLPGSVNSRS